MRIVGTKAIVAAALGLGIAGSGVTSPGTAAASVTTGVTSDFNGDGYQDLAIGVGEAPVGDKAAAGYVAVVYGSANGLNTSHRSLLNQSWGSIPGSAEEGDQFGSALAVGDFNGDGHADLAVGSPGEQLATTVNGTTTQVEGVGMVHVIFGGVGGFQGAVAITPDPVRRLTYFGQQLGAGDVNGDGRDELFVTQEIGSTTLYSYSWGPGAGVSAPTQRSLIAQGNNINDFVVADATGDKQPDLVLSSYGYADPSTRRDLNDHVWIYPGQSGSLLSPVLSIYGGKRLAVGDLNRDGYPDLVASAPADPYHHTSAKGGYLSLLYGSAQGLGPEKIIYQDTSGVPGVDESGDNFGDALAIGDVTGDGYPDLAIGVSGEDVGAIDTAGGAVLLRGSRSGLTTSGAQSFTQNTAGIPGTAEAIDSFGGAVRLIDFNKDGKAELVISSPDENQHQGTVAILKGAAAGAATSGVKTFDASTLGAPVGRFVFGAVLAGGRDR
jgi:hypothetical protein